MSMIFRNRVKHVRNFVDDMGTNTEERRVAPHHLREEGKGVYEPGSAAVAFVKWSKHDVAFLRSLQAQELQAGKEKKEEKRVYPIRTINS